MSHPFTRRNVTAIAKLDFNGLGHAQRVEAIARALGYETAAALMGVLKSEEAAALAPATPVTAIVAFGQRPCSAIESNEQIRDRNGDIDGDLSEITFGCQAELAAYVKGLSDADGWMETMIVANTVDDPTHAFFAARATDPTLDFVTWHDAEIARDMEEEDFEDEDDID